MTSSARPVPRSEPYLRVYGRAIGGGAKKRRPTANQAKALLATTDGACLYCANPIGAKVLQGTRLVTLRLNWDHFIPHAYAANNPLSNWVPACHVCNGIKGPRMFDTVREAAAWVLARWVDKGYRTVDPALVARLTQVEAFDDSRLRTRRSRR